MDKKELLTFLEENLEIEIEKVIKFDPVETIKVSLTLFWRYYFYKLL